MTVRKTTLKWTIVNSVLLFHWLSPARGIWGTVSTIILYYIILQQTLVLLFSFGLCNSKNKLCNLDTCCKMLLLRYRNKQVQETEMQACFSVCVCVSQVLAWGHSFLWLLFKQEAAESRCGSGFLLLCLENPARIRTLTILTTVFYDTFSSHFWHFFKLLCCSVLLKLCGMRLEKLFKTCWGCFSSTPEPPAAQCRSSITTSLSTSVSALMRLFVLSVEQ